MEAINTQEFTASPTTVDKKPEKPEAKGKTKIGVPVDEKKDPPKKDPEKK